MTDSDKIHALNCIIYGQLPKGYQDLTSVLKDFFDVYDIDLYVLQGDNLDKIGLLHALSVTPNINKIYVDYNKLMEKLLSWIPERTEIAIINAVHDGKVRIKSEKEASWQRQEALLINN